LKNVTQIEFGRACYESNKGLSLIEVLLIIAIVSLLLVAVVIHSVP